MALFPRSAFPAVTREEDFDGDDFTEMSNSSRRLIDLDDLGWGREMDDDPGTTFSDPNAEKEPEDAGDGDSDGFEGGASKEKVDERLCFRDVEGSVGLVKLLETVFEEVGGI